jgi:hypothetical protein
LAAVTAVPSAMFAAFVLDLAIAKSARAMPDGVVAPVGRSCPSTGATGNG